MVKFIFCFGIFDEKYLDLNKDGYYHHFLNNEQTANHYTIIYGIRELNINEAKQYCLNKTLEQNLEMIREPFSFSSNYRIRVYQSGCFYLDANQYWRSDGLVVSFSFIYFSSCFIFLRLGH